MGRLGAESSPGTLSCSPLVRLLLTRSGRLSPFEVASGLRVAHLLQGLSKRLVEDRVLVLRLVGSHIPWVLDICDALNAALDVVDML